MSLSGKRLRESEQSCSTTPELMESAVRGLLSSDGWTVKEDEFCMLEEMVVLQSEVQMLEDGFVCISDCVSRFYSFQTPYDESYIPYLVCIVHE